jgi:hypothetical protein
MEGRSRKEVVAMGLTHWWKTGAAPNGYEFGLAEETFEGQQVAYLRSIVRPGRSFGAFCQTIAAEDYRGTRVRFSAALKRGSRRSLVRPQRDPGRSSSPGSRDV